MSRTNGNSNNIAGEIPTDNTVRGVISYITIRAQEYDNLVTTRAENQKLRDQLATLNRGVKYSCQQDCINSRLSESSAEFDNLLANIESLSVALEAAEKENLKLNEQLKAGHLDVAKDAHIKYLSSVVDGLSKRIDKSEASTVKPDSDELQRTIDYQKLKIANLESILKGERAATTALSRKIEDLHRADSANCKKIAELNAALASANATILKLNDKFANIASMFSQ